MRSIRNTALVPTLVLSLLLAGCGSGGGGDFNIVSLDEEWRLGAQLAADIERQMPIHRDPAANAYINQVGRQLVAASGSQLAQLPWNFHIVNSPEVNAFNIPGGHVYVTTGLINAADNASELIGVLAHETVHGLSRHGTEQLSKAYGLNIIASLLLGGGSAPAYQQILAQIVGTGALASFGRDAEREADRVGTRLMYDIGYDPEGMATMFEELLRTRQRAPNAVDKFFSTHPLTEDRIRYTRAEAAKFPRKSGLRRDDAQYQAVRRSL